MICPVCGTDNLTGAEVCDNCGADLAGTGRPAGDHLVPRPAPRRAPRRPRRAGAGRPSTPDTPRSTRPSRRCTRPSVDCLLVVEGGKLVGIFTDRDAVVRRSPASSLEASHIARRHDARPGHRCATTTRSPLAIHKMAVGGFRHIPIVENGRPTGVVTARDVFHHLARRRSA